MPRFPERTTNISSNFLKPKKSYTLIVRISLFFMTAIAIFLFGMISYKENLLPRKIIYEIKSHIIPKDKPLSESHHKTSGNVQSPPKFRILPYAQGTPLFIDRNYEDSIGSESLNSTYVIQLPRHFSGCLPLHVFKRILVYRILSTQNDNQVFFDWNKTEIQVCVEGASAKHSLVVSKTFEPGVIDLYSGGPICSSPILIKQPDIAPSAPPFSIQ
jgi:hypothetical protein